MILAKAPLRVSFLGGGSDIQHHFEEHGGATVSMAIDKYVYVSVMKTPHRHIKVSYSQQEVVDDVNDIKNDIVRETLKWYGIESNIEINTFADIPTIGTGLGGSSAFTCALIAALDKLLYNKDPNPFDVAELACMIEIGCCGWNIGEQDQYASAFGGMNFIEYSLTGNRVSRMNANHVADKCVLIPTLITRHSSDIIDSIDFNKKGQILKEMAAMACLLYENEVSFGSVAPKLLNHAWDLKKQLSSGISNSEIDTLANRALSNGADAVKLLGAGGGGYMLAMGDIERIRSMFLNRTLLTFKVSNEGARVVYQD